MYLFWWSYMCLLSGLLLTHFMLTAQLDIYSPTIFLILFPITSVQAFIGFIAVKCSLQLCPIFYMFHWYLDNLSLVINSKYLRLGNLPAKTLISRYHHIFSIRFKSGHWLPNFNVYIILKTRRHMW